MSSSPALSHDGAGRAGPCCLGLRLAELEPEANAASGARALELPWTGASASLGPAVVELRAEPVEDVLHLHARLRTTARAHVAAVRVGIDWDPDTPRPLRFLQHGWQAEVETGSRALEGDAGGWDLSRSLPLAEDRGKWQASDLVTVVGAVPGGPACLVGVIENGAAYGRIHLQRRGRVLRLEVELSVGAVLEAGRELELGTVHVALGTDASRLLTAFGAVFGARAGARVWRPFLASAELSRETLLGLDPDALATELASLLPGRDALPIDTLVLHDSGACSPAGWQRAGRVPMGLARVARAMDAADFIPGLRLAPFQDAEGRALDLGRPEVTQEIEKQAAGLCAAGFRYFEIEGGGLAARTASAADPGTPSATHLRRALEALRRGVGEEAFLLGLDLPFGVAVGVLDAMRLVPPCGVGDAVAPVVRSGMSRAWMHRRLFLGDASPSPGFARRDRAEADALAAVTAIGAVVSIVHCDETLDEDGRALLAATILETQRIDRCGIPGTLRLSEPLAASAHGFTARDDSGVYRGFVNVGERGVDRVVETYAELRIGAAGEVAPGRRTIAPSSGAIVHASVPHPIAVFCDFDGTFTLQDVGATLAQRYAPERRAKEWARYQAGELTPWQYNMRILNHLPVPQDELEAFLRDEIELNGGARELLDFCHSRGLPFRILSDGFDWNIGRLQVLHGVSFDYEANRMHYQEGHWRIGPGAPDPSCGCGTGVCKSGVLRRHRLRHPEARLVHIGNGRVSDTCGAMEADQAFAKDSLAPELERRGKPYEPFETLLDVIPVLEHMLSRVG